MTDQEKREKVKKGLLKLHENSGCIAVHDCDCKTCPYERVNGCCDQIIVDALELLKAYEPRLLTMEEVNNLPSCHVVIELNERYGGFLHWIDGLLFCRNIDGSTDFITLCGKTRLPREEYGKKWRCWDKYISGAQGEATPWRS